MEEFRSINKTVSLIAFPIFMEEFRSINKTLSLIVFPTLHIRIIEFLLK